MQKLEQGLRLCDKSPPGSLLILLIIGTTGILGSERTIGHTGVFKSSLYDNYLYETHYILSFIIPYPRLRSPMDIHEDPELLRKLPIFSMFLPLLDDLINGGYRIPVQSSIGTRKKRALEHGALPFIGWLQQKIGGVALTSDLDDLKVQSQELTDHVTEIKEVLKHQGKSIEKLLNETETLNKFVNALAQEVSENRRKIIELETMVHAVEENLKALAYILQKSLVLITLKNHLDEELNRVRSGLDQCYSGYLSYDLLNTTELKTRLLLTVPILRAIGMELSIPITRIEWYYQFKLTHCLSEPDKFFMALALPIRSLGAEQAQFFQLNYFPFMVQGDIFQLSSEEKVLGYTDSTGTYLAHQFESMCITDDDSTLASCLLKINQLTPVLPGSCEDISCNGGSVLDFKNTCKLQHSRLKGNWVKVNESNWIYTGTARNLTYICKNKTSTLELGGLHRSSMIKIPCNCYIPDKEWLFLTSQRTCFSGPNIEINHMYAAFYLQYDQLMLPGGDMLTPFSFTPKLTPLNLSLSPFDHLEDFEHLREDSSILEKETPLINWESPFHSIWYILTIVVSVIIILVVLYCIWKHRGATPAGFLALSSTPKGAAAFDLATNIDATIDIVCFLGIFFVLFLIYRLLKRLTTSLKCHSMSVEELPQKSGPHLDIVFSYYGTPIQIGLRSLRNTANLYFYSSCQGEVSYSNGLLHVTGASVIKSCLQEEVDINGLYHLRGLTNFDNTHFIVKAGTY